MEVSTEKFIAGSRKTLKDERLLQALYRATTRAVNDRNQAASALPEWEELRNSAREIKRQTLEYLDEYLALLAEEVTANGGLVYWAATAADAADYITHLARKNNARTVVKGKSMATEEIGLNELLEKMDIEALETDLGEYVVQLAGEKPYHIITPAIHKTRQDIGRLFQQKLGAEYEEDPEKLAKIARRTLRQKFMQADLGVTGANFAVAETGTVIVVENEGNGRLSSSMPKVHVALMGMEKVIPSLEDLAVFLALLPRSGTGQKITSYVSLFHGPRRPGETGGPDEFHLVILDNGRSRILADPAMRESLYCIRCGACLNVCPVYRKVGGHAYGWVYSGPIGKVLTPELVGVDRAKDLPNASTLCAACRDICPLKIDIPHMLLKLRHKLTEGDGPGAKPKPKPMEKAVVRLWAEGMKHPRAYHMASRAASIAQKPLVRHGKIRKLPSFLGNWTEHRDFPPLAKKPFRQIWKEWLSRES